MQTTLHHRQVKRVINQMVREVLHSPGGYTYLSQLPLKGLYAQSTMVRRWVGYVRKVTLPDDMLQAMVKACLTEEGKIDDRGRGLALWLVKNVYNTPQSLFNVWLERHSTLHTTSKLHS